MGLSAIYNERLPQDDRARAHTWRHHRRKPRHKFEETADSILTKPSPCNAATPKMEIPGIYGFHFLVGVGRVTRAVRDGNIQTVKRRPRRVLLRVARAFPGPSNVRRLCKWDVVTESSDFLSPIQRTHRLSARFLPLSPLATLAAPKRTIIRLAEQTRPARRRRLMEFKRSAILHPRRYPVLPDEFDVSR